MSPLMIEGVKRVRKPKGDHRLVARNEREIVRGRDKIGNAAEPWGRDIFVICGILIYYFFNRSSQSSSHCSDIKMTNSHMQLQHPQIRKMFVPRRL